MYITFFRISEMMPCIVKVQSFGRYEYDNKYFYKILFFISIYDVYFISLYKIDLLRDL